MTAKNANFPIKSPLRNDFATVARASGVTDVVAVGETIRHVVLVALNAVESARSKALQAGQALNEARVRLAQPRNGGRFASPDGDGFMEFLGKVVPEITPRTAQNWMRAAANVVAALPPLPGSGGARALPEMPGGVIDVEAEVTVLPSQVLATPDEELTFGEREWKQAWFELTSDRTIKECLNGVFVDGDEGHRIDRAINGKTKGGGGGDRKDFPLFVARKLRDLSSHMSHWEGMNERQRTEVKAAVMAAITGDEVKVRAARVEDGQEGILMRFGDGWPVEVCHAAIEALRERVKGVER